MQKLSTSKMMEKLSGRELFTAVMTGYVERIGNQPCSFTDEDYDRALNALEKKPYDYREYYRWCRAEDAISFLTGEIRVMAMEGCWKLGILKMHLLDAMRQPEKKSSKNTQPERIKMIAAKIRSEIQEIHVQLLALKAFGDVIGANLLALVKREISLLEQNIVVYDHLSAVYDDCLTLLQRKKTPIECFLPAMPALGEEASPDLHMELTDSIRTYRGDNFLEVLLTLYEAIKQHDVFQCAETEEATV